MRTLNGYTLLLAALGFATGKAIADWHFGDFGPKTAGSILSLWIHFGMVWFFLAEKQR